MFSGVFVSTLDGISIFTMRLVLPGAIQLNCSLLRLGDGTGNRTELRSLLRKSLSIIAVTGLILTAIAELTAPWLSSIFVGYDPQLESLTEHAIRISMLSFLLCGFNIFCSGWFTALNNGLVSAIASFVRTLVFEMATVFILPSIIGINGIWSSVCVAEILAFIMTCALILGFRRRYLGE